METLDAGLLDAMKALGLSDHVGNYEISKLTMPGNPAHCLKIESPISSSAGPKADKLIQEMAKHAVTENSKAVVKLEREAVKIAESLRATKPDTALFIYHNLGVAMRDENNLEKAIRYLTLGKATAEETGSVRNVAELCLLLTLALYNHGQYETGSEVIGEGIAAYKHCGDTCGLGQAYDHQGMCFRGMGLLDKAVEAHTQSVEFLGRLNNKDPKTRALLQLALCLRERGDYDEAIPKFKETIRAFRELRDNHREGRASLDLGICLYLKARKICKSCASLEGPYDDRPKCIPDSVIEMLRESQMHMEHSDAVYSNVATEPAAGRHLASQLHLSHVHYLLGNKALAVNKLNIYLEFLMAIGRARCMGCGQIRGEDVAMMACSGCMVARFCNAEHQKLASKASGGVGGAIGCRHSRICWLLNSWRIAKQLKLQHNQDNSHCVDDMLAFLEVELQGKTRREVVGKTHPGSGYQEDVEGSGDQDFD